MMREYPDLQVFQSVIATVIRVDESVTIPVQHIYVDVDNTEEADFTIVGNDAGIPAHQKTTVRIPLAPGPVIGYKLNVHATHLLLLDIQVIAQPVSTYANEAIFPFYEVLYKGNPELKMYVDGVLKDTSSPGNVSDWTTKRIYLPNGTRGYIPNLHWLPDPVAGTEVANYRLMTQDPAAFQVPQLFHSAMIVYSGSVAVNLDLDGVTKATGSDSSSNLAHMHIEYPENTVGILPSYEETSGSGKIFNVMYKSEVI